MYVHLYFRKKHSNIRTLGLFTIELKYGLDHLPNWYRNIRFSTTVINLIIITGFLFYETSEKSKFSDKMKSLNEKAMNGIDNKQSKYLNKNNLL